MRTLNSVKNISFGLISQITSSIFGFLIRIVFIRTLGAEYLGIEGLFSNVLSLISLTNLGIESAIIFSLYKPLQEKNNEEIKGYMQFYKNVYKIIGIIIFVIGILLIPFLPYIIKGSVNVKENIVVLYILYLLDTSISYFYVYKKSLLIANQQNYDISKIHTIMISISNIVLSILLIIFKKFLVFLIVQLIFRFLENVIVSKKADKEFPILNDKNIKGVLSKEKRHDLYKKVYSMFLYKISGTVINSTDNIIISSFVGVIYVGIYSNYLLIINTIRTFVSYIFSSLTASVGNLVVSDEENKKKMIFDEIFFMSFWIYGFCSIALYVLVNDFITICFGKKYVLDQITVIIIIINFYTTGMQSASSMYRDTTGLFSVGKYRPIFAAVINLMVSIILAPKLKIRGVLLGTIVSRLCVYFWFDPYIVYKHIFNQNCFEYFKKYIKYTIMIIIIGLFINLLTININISSIYISFIIKCFICTIIPNLIIFLIYLKDEKVIYIINIFKNLYKIKQISS